MDTGDPVVVPFIWYAANIDTRNKAKGNEVHFQGVR